MRIRPRHARAALARVNLARLRAGWPVGLRDGAILALAAAGLTASEISKLRATAITVERGKLLVTVERDDIQWSATLPVDLGGRLLAWLSERRLWGTDEPVFAGRRRRPIATIGVHCVLHRYHGRRRARR